MALTLLLRILIFTLFPFDVAVIDSNRRRTLSSVSAVPWGASARIFPSYHHRFGRLTPDYMCQKNCVEQSQPACQPIPGTGIDEAIGQLLVQSVTPLALEVALNVQSEIQQRLAEADRLRQQQVQRARYEADRARIRYMRVDPNNRLVADTLEAQWNENLRSLAQAK